MLKRDLLEFIERVEEKAIKSVEDKWNKLIKDKKNEVLSKYEDKFGLYQSVFNNFQTNLVNLLSDIKEDVEINFKGSKTIDYGFGYLSNIRGSIIDRCSFGKKVDKLSIKQEKEIEEVRINYRKVYMVSKSMSSAKKIAEYLEALGFDISSLKEDEIQYLSTDIDKSKLFVCGENH